MAKHVRWVRFEVPVFVKVVYDDAFDEDMVEKAVVVDEREDFRLAESRSGQPEVFDAEFEKTTNLADKVTEMPSGSIGQRARSWCMANSGSPAPILGANPTGTTMPAIRMTKTRCPPAGDRR